jgi:hypothetical protein
VFGVGWGLSGFCPGPAITSIPLFAQGTLVFVASMIAGIALTRVLVQPKIGVGSAAAGSSEA